MMVDEAQKTTLKLTTQREASTRGMFSVVPYQSA